MVELDPTHEVREGVDVVWQIPPNPKAILFLAHSANGTPLSFWPPTPKAPKCKGTPEHSTMTRHALERGFAVIASDCVAGEWETWPTTNVDIQNNLKILKTWLNEHKLEELPLSALGTSNGGDFVSCLSTVIRMHSLVVMISKGSSEPFEGATAGEYPPTLFVPMIKDEKTVTQVKKNNEILMKRGIPSAIVGAPPLEVHPHFFAERIDGLDKEQSAKLHSSFVEHGVLSKDNAVTKMMMAHDVEPHLRKAGILPPGTDEQMQRDEVKLKGGGGRGGPPHKGPPHEGPPHGGPPHDGPPGGGVGERRGPPPPGQRGGRGPPGGGRGPPGGGPGRGGGPVGGGPGGRGPGGRGRGGGPGGGPPPSHPLAEAVQNQLMVAEGNHTLTSRHDDAVFDWFEGKTWPQIQAQ